MSQIKTLNELEALYGEAVPAALTKVATSITPLYREWISASRFAVLSTVGPEGTDASPRGDSGPVVTIPDKETLLLPDWRGNNRLDSLRNIVRDQRVSLMFMISGCNNVVRVNGIAVISADKTLIKPFERQGKTPKTVIIVKIREVYFQCAKAIMRSEIWLEGGNSTSVPTAGDFIREMRSDFDGRAYDEAYSEYAKSRMW